LLIDDGSTDSSGEICDVYGAKYDCIRVFHIDNSGPGGARNKGIEEATGEYVTFVDADDTVDEDFLEILAAEDNLTHDVVFFGWVMESGGQGVVHSVRRRYEGTDFCRAAMELSGVFTFENNSNNLIRRSLLKDNRVKYREKMSNHEDDLFTYSYARYMRDFVILPVHPYHSHYDDRSIHLSHRNIPSEEEYRTYGMITRAGLKLSDAPEWRRYLLERFFHVMDNQLFYLDRSGLKQLFSRDFLILYRNTGRLYKMSGLNRGSITKYDIYYLFINPLWFILFKYIRHAVPGRTVS
jgi:glycosyltransferase involved in cell wall biosynthesis